MTMILDITFDGALHHHFTQEDGPMHLHLGPATYLQQVSIAPCPRPLSGGNNVATAANAHEATHGKLSRLRLKRAMTLFSPYQGGRLGTLPPLSFC